VSRFKIGQVDLIAFTAGDSLQCDQVGERADRGFHPVDATSLRASEEIREAHGHHLLGKQVEVAVWRCKVDRPAANDAVFWDRGTVGTSRPPALNQSTNALHVGRIGIEDGIDSLVARTTP